VAFVRRWIREREEASSIHMRGHPIEEKFE
jgi:hypothetical protein